MKIDFNMSNNKRIKKIKIATRKFVYYLFIGKLIDHFIGVGKTKKKLFIIQMYLMYNKLIQ